MKEIPVLYSRKEECCGCTACYAICPKEAISMVEDEEGFEYPQIDESKCVRCYQLSLIHIIALLSIAAPVISHFGTKHRIQKKEYIWVLLGVAALLLTAKRAHLLFTMSALIISYFALSEGKRCV